MADEPDHQTLGRPMAILTFALTFSNDAGFTSEKQMRNTSCKKTKQMSYNNYNKILKIYEITFSGTSLHKLHIDDDGE